MSDITKMNLIAIVQKLPNEDIEFIQTCITMLENKITHLQKEKDKYKNVIDKIKELIERKLSTETYQHLKKLYDDIDNTEEIWEDYEFEDLLDILELLEKVE
jgi:hypothetical protein